MVQMARLQQAGAIVTLCSGWNEDPLTRESIESFAAIALDENRFAELQAHLLVMGDDVGLDHQHHVLPEHYLAPFAAARGARLDNGRVLIGAVEEIVIDGVAAAMNDLCSLLNFLR